MHRIIYILLFILGIHCGFGQSVLRDKVHQTYTNELGVREATGKNDGARVECYLKYVNLGKGNPWCAAFVCWTLNQNKIVNPISGWSPALFPTGNVIYLRTRNNNLLPTTGDVFGIYFPEKKRIAHVGFVDGWPINNKWVITVEGNTNEAGSREGDGVYRKRRLKSAIYAVSTFIK